MQSFPCQMREHEGFLGDTKTIFPARKGNLSHHSVHVEGEADACA